jgi:8-oxo-dGTP pyrophosphatase MutT (NUDIX family)
MGAGVGKAVGGAARSTVRQQVAAVCYRDGTRGVEFLLVQTRGGRWTFPKGGVEAGLTQAQSAALEAFEEAGVHGRIEEMPFARYRVGKADGKKTRRKVAADGETVTAHLCEVSHLEAPQEAGRTPTWFAAEKAKRRLVAGRDREFGKELANVVDRAVSRIRRLEASAGREFQGDALRTVRFEAFENSQMRPAEPSAALVRQLLLEARNARAKLAGEVEATIAPSTRRKSSYIQ